MGIRDLLPWIKKTQWALLSRNEEGVIADE
jgi:hypothetical protein